MLNRAPNSTQLHLPPPSFIYLYSAPSASTKLMPAFTQLSATMLYQCYRNQNITRNWEISPNLGQKIQSCPFYLKIGSHGILEVVIPNSELDFWNVDPKINCWVNFGRKSQKSPFAWKLEYRVSWGCWFLFRH